MKNFLKKFRKNRWLKRLGVILIIIIVVIIVLKIVRGPQEEDQGEEAGLKKQVVTAVIDLASQDKQFIETVGTVRPESKVDIVATTRGTVRGIFFSVGDEVRVNQVLASLFDSSALTSLNNARTNLINTQSNLSATQLLTDETVRQAEIGVESARESVAAAEIGLKTAKDNLANSQALTDKSNLDTISNSIVAFNGYMNTLFTALDDTDEILKIEDENESGKGVLVSPSLSAENPGALSAARASYRQTSNLYLSLQSSPTPGSIEQDMVIMVNALTWAEQMVNDMVKVLDNTVSGTDYPIATLDLIKTNFILLRSTVVGALTSAKATEQGLQNLDLLEDQQITALENAVTAAESQLAIAQAGLSNAIVALENTKQTKRQQELNSQSAIDNARGQLDLAQVQVGDLTLSSPIAGVITQKTIDLGAEINPGQKIAEVSQNERLKIEVNLPSEDVYRIQLGQFATLDDNFTGQINSIDPAADSVTRKIKVEILFDNNNQDLIQGTFIDVTIPVTELERTNLESVFIPLKAVTIAQSEQFVFTISEGRAKKTPVVIGKTEGTLVEILNGLEQADVLIVEGAKNLNDGDEITEAIN